MVFKLIIIIIFINLEFVTIDITMEIVVVISKIVSYNLRKSIRDSFRLEKLHFNLCFIAFNINFDFAIKVFVVLIIFFIIINAIICRF